MPLTLPHPHELRALRKHLGLTQAEVARMAGVSQPLVARIEKGSVDPRLSTVRKIVRALTARSEERVTLAQIMASPVVFAKPNDPLASVARLMRTRGFSQIPVLQKGAVVGTILEERVVHALESKDVEEVKSRPVREIMGPPLPTSTPETIVDDALPLLEHHPAILVLEKGRVVGLVARSDLLRIFEGTPRGRALDRRRRIAE